MEAVNKITCPKCNHAFNAEEALAHNIEEKLKAEYLLKQKESELELKEKENKLRAVQAKFIKDREDFARQKEEMEELIRQKLKEEKLKLEEELKGKVKLDFELQLKNLQEDLANKAKENRDLKNKEIELLRKEKELRERKEELDIEAEKKFLEKCKEIEDDVKKRTEESALMKIKEKDMQMDALKKQVEDMKRRIEQGSMQLQGEVQEVILEELLKNTFTFDRIEEVGKGVRGADVIHTVRNSIGTECGKIIYESKRTKTFSDTWIEKLKNDLRGQSADLAVIVTESMPKEMDQFGVKDGIWICNFQEVKGLAMILRDSLIRIEEVRASQENKGDKMQMLYDYLTRNEFRQQIEAIVEGFVSMQKGLQKEKLVTNKLWKEREKQLEKVLQNTIDMYGCIKGIAGSAVADIKELDYPELLLGEGNEE